MSNSQQSQINKEFVDTILSELLSIDKGPKLLLDDQNKVYQCFSLTLEKLTLHRSIGFTSLFARLAYAKIHFQLPGKWCQLAQLYKRSYEKKELSILSEKQQINLGLWVIVELFYLTEWVDKNTYPLPNLEGVTFAQKPTLKFKRVLEASLVEVSNESITVVEESQPHLLLKVKLDFEDSHKFLEKVEALYELPIRVNLVDFRYENDTEGKASIIVVEPDLLVGVTSISECFMSDSSTILQYLSRKLLPINPSEHLLVGNIVNFYLDELIYNPSLSFKDLLNATFGIGPDQFALMDNETLRNCIGKLETHFYNLKDVVQKELAEVGITKSDSYLEPSFYSSAYGIQGRLDLLHFNQSGDQVDIVELKSGKLYKATNGLNQNHYVQTLLYDLLLESVYEGKLPSKNYILYSSVEKQRLRFAPRIRNKQLEALMVRNKIVLAERALSTGKGEIEKIISAMNPEGFSEKFKFLKRDLRVFWQDFGLLTELEKSYYLSFLEFIGKEFVLSKIGKHGVFQHNGLASLWLDPLAEKVDRFTVLSLLEVKENLAQADLPTITLSFSERSNSLSKFRKGDITVLYPYIENQDSVLSSQLFRCTIIALDKSGVTVRLRARQQNVTIFEKFKYWNLETDVLDSSFNQLYHNLYRFIASVPQKRNLILGLEAPKQPNQDSSYKPQLKVTNEQQHVIQNAINAKDYFMIWGPPGTGKTSIVISELIHHYYTESSHNILLLAYTNRAVDEICEAVEKSIGRSYIRIGSRYSTDKKYADRLLVTKLEDIGSRKQIKALYEDNRVFVSTVSSFLSKKELHKLVSFDIAIIDEASQLLEPLLVGVLSMFSKYILIGDHKQLPAVVTQDKQSSILQEGHVLNSIFLKDRATSYFERMYLQAVHKAWTHTFGRLTQQGRMHQDILRFVSDEFYEGNLSILPGLSRLTEGPQLKYESELQATLVNNRMIFINTPVDKNLIQKTNETEAKMASFLAQEWIQIIRHNDLACHDGSLGIITPFRAQIALIKNSLGELSDLLSVDTVERYQGGARDVIIISLAISKAEMMDSIKSISEEGVDRKLNVALTRCRNNLIILGPKAILKTVPVYRRLIEACYELTDLNSFEAAILTQ